MKRIQELISTLFQSRIRAIITIGILVCVVALIWNRTRPTTKEPEYVTAPVERGTLIVSIAASGQITNANSGSIGTQASGVIKRVLVENGQYVEQGAVIAEIELDQTGKQNYLQASSSYQSAKNALENANTATYTADAELFTQWEKFRDLASNSFYQNGDGSPNTTNRDLPEFRVAQDAWLAAEAKYKTQKNVIAQSQTALQASYLSYLETSPTVYAPISGTVTGLSLQVGSVLTTQTGSAGTITSQKVASIKTNAAPTLSVNLTEIDVPTVQIGDKATVTLSAFPEKSFTGEIISIDTVGTISSGVTTYPTVIQFDTEVPEIFSNMTADANIITDTKTDALIVPASAIQTLNGATTVRVFENGQVRETPVVTGMSSGTHIEIVSGIEEGQTIVTSIASTTTQGSTGQATSPFSSFGGGGMRGATSVGTNSVRITR